MKARMSRLYLVVGVFTNLILLLGILLLLALLDNYLNAFIQPISYITHLFAHFAGKWVMLSFQAIPPLLAAYWINRLLLPRLSISTSTLLVIILLTNTLYILHSYFSLINL